MISPRTHVLGGFGGATKSRTSRFTLTGSRTCGAWPEPARTTRSPRVCSTSAAARVREMMASSSPWNDEHRTTDATGELARLLRLEPGAVLGCHEGLRSRAEAPTDAVFDGLRRVRLREHAREEELEKAAIVAEPVVLVVFGPAHVGLKRLVPCVDGSLGQRVTTSRPGGGDEDRRLDTLGMLGRQA